MKRFLWPSFALAGGALWGLCFSAEPFHWAPWVALTPLLLLLRHPDAGKLGFLFLLASWVVAIPWIAPTLVTFGGLSPLLAWPLLLLLAAYLSLFGWAFARLSAPIWRRGAAPWVFVGLPAVWVVLEWVRAWLLSGFPWNLAAYSVTETSGALEVSGWIGAYGVSFLVVWANAGVALSLARRRWQFAAWGLLVPMTLLASADRWERRIEPADSAPLPIEVRVLQPNIPNLVEWDAARVGENYARLIAQSHAACDRPGTLLIWPESAAWPFELGREPRLASDLAALHRKGCSVLLNSVRREGEAVYNAAFLVGDDEMHWYAKRHLVPFGEFVPLRTVLPFVGTLARNAGQFTPGSEARLLPFGAERLGPAICYEVVYPGEVAETVKAGATLLVSITNDDWYGPTAAPWQHLRAARFRAAESRRTTFRAAITGVSAIIDTDGSLLAAAGPGEERILEARVIGRTDRSVYSQFAWLFPWVYLAVAAFAIFWSRRGGRSAAGPSNHR